MGILEDLEEKLKGEATQEVVVPTPLPQGESSLDKLAKKLEFKERTDFFMSNDAAMNPDQKITMPKPGEQYQPQVSDRFRKTFEDPNMTPEAVAKRRSDQIKFDAMRRGVPSMGPAGKPAEFEPALPPGMTAGTMAGRRAAQEEDWSNVGKLMVVGQFIDRLIGSASGGLHKTNAALAKAADYFEKITGAPKGGLFSDARDAAKFYQDYYTAKSGKVTGTKQKELPETAKIIADTAGGLIVDLPQIIALGPYGLALHGAAYGLAENGLEGMVTGAVQGSLVHGIFRGIAQLPTLWQAPAAAIIGSATTAMETDDPRQILSAGMTWGLLQGKGHGNKTARDFALEIAESPLGQDVTKAYRTVKGERAVKKLRDKGISREEFILRFPEMKAHLRDMDVEGVIKSLDPDMDLEGIRDAGGALKAVEWTLGPLRHQHKLVTDMVRSRINLPTERVANALQSMAERMSDDTLKQQHYMAKLNVKEGAEPMAYWQASVYEGELMRRGVEPLISGEEYVLTKYGKQGWDEITGHPALQQKALDNVTAELNKRGILTGEAAARAEADSDPAPGFVKPALFKAMYNAELKKLMGLNPMPTAPQWADYFKGSQVPRGAKLVDVKPEDRLTISQLFLGTGRSRGYITPAGYMMVPAPKDHPRANSRGLIPWHQLVMENKLGRLLQEGEVVHHKNHRPYDNSPDNLEIMNYDDHIRYHKSAAAKAIDDQIYADEMAKGPEKAYRIENYDTMELRHSTEVEEPGPREFKISVQKPRYGRPVTEFEGYGEGFEPWELRQISKGKLETGPEGEPPYGATLPSGDRFLGLERFKVEKNGDITMIAHLVDADGTRFTKELTRLTPDEKARYKSGKDWGDLIDDVVARVSQDRPAGGTPVKYLKKGEKAPKELDLTIEDVETGMMRFPDSVDEEVGPNEILTSGDEILKKGSNVRQRKLDELRWPTIEKPPAGVEKYPEGLLLSDDFKAREQLTVRDVLKSHHENGGSTVNIYEGDMAGTDMWAVSLYPERTFKKDGAKLTKKELYNFIRKNADLLSSDPRLNVGSWYNKEEGVTYLDVTMTLPKDQEALAVELGRKYNQKAITLLDKEFTFPEIKTGGNGKVLKKAGWLPEMERADEIFQTGEMRDVYHFGNAPDITPQAMGRGEIGEEGEQFARGYRGTDMLRQGFYPKSNFYTPETKNVEAHRWGGKGLGKGQVDMGQLFNAKDMDPESPLSLDQQAVRAGKRGWYDPKTEQVRLFTPNQVKHLGTFEGAGRRNLRGSEIEKYLRPESGNLTSGPEDPVEDYSVSKVFGKPHERGALGPISGQEVLDTANRLRFLLFDKFSPIHDLMKKMEKAGIDVPLMQNPSHMVKLLGGLTGKADAKVFFKRFTVSSDGKIRFNGESLNDIYKPHKGDMAGLDDWLWARAEREEHRLNQGRTPDEQVRLELTPQEAEQIYQDGLKKYGKTGKKFTEYFHSLLDELADSGLMTAEEVADLKALRPDYAPLRKDLDEIVAKLDAASGTNSARQTLDRVKNPLRARRGTEKEYERIPPTQAAVMMTYEITSAVERNRAARAVVELRDLSPEMAKIITPVRPKITYVRDVSTGQDVPTIGRQEADVISVSIEGKRHFFRVPEDVAQSMKMIYETGLGRWVKLMSIPARTLRTGATAAPEFAFRNPLRDWLTAFMNAKHGFNPLTDFSRGLFQLVFQGKGPEKVYKLGKMDPEAYWKWKAAGGEWSMLVSLDKSLGEQAVKQMHKETDTGLKAMRKYIKSPLGYLEAISEAGEKPTRLGVFERSQRHGLSDVEAALQSRMASTDFAIRGAETKAMSALYTFLNARAQTTIQLGKTAVNNPTQFALKGLAAAGIPSIVLYALNREDPDYWKRDQMERDLFWFLPIDIAGRQVKIPKGEIGLIFGTAVEKVLTWLDHEGVLPEGGGGRPPLNPQVTEFLGEVFQNLSPMGNWGETLPTFARPIMEWVNNKSYYYGTPLESEADLGVAPYRRFKPGTSEVMKEIGQALGAFNKGKGVSPIKMENTLRGYTGGVGRHTLRAVDWVADKLGITEAGARPSDPMNIPGMSGFVSRRAVGFESEPAKQFYEVVQEVEMTKRTLGELLDDKTKAEEALTWVKRHEREINILSSTKVKDPETGKISDLLNDSKRRLAELRKQMNIIAENKSLTGAQKRQALNHLDKEVSKVVDPMWDLINAASQTRSKK